MVVAVAAVAAVAAAVGLHESETSEGVVGFGLLTTGRYRSGRKIVIADSPVAARKTTGGLNDLAGFQNAVSCVCERMV